MTRHCECGWTVSHTHPADTYILAGLDLLEQLANGELA